MADQFKTGEYLTIIRRHIDRVTRTRMKGWQGRLATLEVVEGKGLHVFMEWDSPTLMALPYRYLARCEKKGIEWHGALIPIRKVQQTERRDTPEQLEHALRQTADRFHRIAEFGRGGELAHQIIKNASTIEAQEKAWLAYLRTELKVPFDALVDYLDGWDDPDYYEGYAVLDDDEEVRVLKVDGIESGLGVTVLTRFRRREEVLPLMMLWASGTARTRRIVDAYRYWFETQ